jgi:hypothetical protein
MMNLTGLKLRNVVLALAVVLALSLSASAQAVDQAALDALMRRPDRRSSSFAATRWFI